MKILKELRRQKGKTQTQMGEYLGISQQAYATYEIETRTPPIDIINKLADYFNVSVDYLLGRTNNPEPKERFMQSNVNLNEIVKSISERGLNQSETTKFFNKLKNLTKEELLLFIK